MPEHFSTPIAFAVSKNLFEKRGIEVQLIPYPSGSGHLIQSLTDGSLDIAVGLTEAFVRGIAQGNDSYKLVGTYVQSPLRWAVSTGSDRSFTDKDELNGKRIGVSRIGSGSYVMAFVLALQQGFKRPFFEKFPVVSTFKNLRDSVNLKEVNDEGESVEPSDAFMWEYFTTKRYYDSGEVKQIGEILTPWPSWVINARTEIVEKNAAQLSEFLKALEEGIAYFKDNKEEAIKYIYTELDYSQEDATEWIKTVEFTAGALNQVDPQVVAKTYKVLVEAGVLTDDEDVIVKRLAEGVVTV